VPPELLHEIYSELALQQILEIEWRLEAQNPDRAEAFRQELAELVAQLLIFQNLRPLLGIVNKSEDACSNGFLTACCT
jgi:plasmid stabilization system protein ParE